jgi:hypothetical protein
MGATEFTTYVAGANLGAAYASAVTDARCEYGNDGYNGTISTTSGYRRVLPTPLTLRAANLYGHTHIDDAQKWEHALAVPVAEDKHFTFRKVKMTVTVDPVNEHGHSASEWDIRDAALRKAFDKYGTSLHEVDVKPSIKTTTVVTQATGRAVTRYEVKTYGTRATLYDTKAQAIAAAKREALSSTGGSASVRAVKFYPDVNGTELAVVAAKTVSASAVLEITVATPRRADTPTTGWLFFGLAAC